jgi:histidyl-tRNA synthetase
MGKISKISGFPEWLPEQKLVEESIISRIRKIYESYGFTPIETPAVELLATLGSKGVIDKEIFAVKRLKAEEDDEAEMGLHFDLTVPFARYVAQHGHALSFPFKRYQLQKVWRGDRPQKGRFREFYQFDIDVIARDSLPLASDAEVISVLGLAMETLNLGAFKIRLNSRKILSALYEGLGLSPAQVKSAIITVDKLNKIGEKGVRGELESSVNLSAPQIDSILSSTLIQCTPKELREKINGLGVKSELLDAGVLEIETIGGLLPERVQQRLIVDVSLARGLDYYSGAIFETVMEQYPEFGTVASGGRYDDLASEFTNEKLPGVGASIGLSRLMELAFHHKLIPTERRSPSQVLVTVYDESDRVGCNVIADILRAEGLNVEVYFKSPKLGKQIEYAEAKGMRYVVFHDAATSEIKVKDLVTKEQVQVFSLSQWAQGITAPV